MRASGKQKREKIFVYGTLRKGFPLYRYIERLRARYVGRGKIRALLYSLGKYPGAVPSASPFKEVLGEVYELQDGKRQLQELDTVEEFYPDRPEESLYIRQRTVVTMSDGRILKAWAYFLPKRPSKARLIQSGDYSRARRLSN